MTNKRLKIILFICLGYWIIRLSGILIKTPESHSDFDPLFVLIGGISLFILAKRRYGKRALWIFVIIIPFFFSQLSVVSDYSNPLSDGERPEYTVHRKPDSIFCCNGLEDPTQAKFTVYKRVFGPVYYRIDSYKAHHSYR